MNRSRNRQREGIVLVWAIFVIVALFGASFVMTTTAATSKRLSDTNQSKVRAEFVARAASARAEQEVYDALLHDSAVPNEGSITLDGETGEYAIEVLTPAQTIVAEDGLHSIETVYRITGSATVDRSYYEFHRVVRGSQVPIFQFALFYESDMHFLYPAPMRISGPVHCNGDMYTYAQKGLEFNTNHVRIVGGLYGSIKDSAWAAKYNWGTNNPATFRRWVSDPFDSSEPYELAEMETKTQYDNWGVPSTSGFDSAFSGYDYDTDGDYTGSNDWLPFGAAVLEKYNEPNAYADEGYTLLTGEHGVDRVELPATESFDMFAEVEGGSYVLDEGSGEFVEATPGQGTHDKAFFHEAAGLSILSSEDGSWHAYDAHGNEVTSQLSSVVTGTSMYDARQAEGSGESIQMTVIDMEELAKTSYYPANGLLYVAGYGSGTGTDVKGFQLTNGAELAGDLTVVSPDSIYVHGDYNTDSKKSAAVMADAVNLLSNSWDNSKTSGTLPTASDTSFNMAILTSESENTSDSWSGGPMNLPRFHEKWSGTNCEIWGSMVCTGFSQKATGKFEVNGDYYRPPNRDWHYDELFNDTANLPPFSPMYVDVDNVAVW